MRSVDVTRIQSVLHQRGSATVYVADVPPGDRDFAAVQWWGTVGGLHGLHPQPERPGQRGKNISGQYHEAYVGHTAELDRPLDDATRARWTALARELGVDASAFASATTRGEFIAKAFAARPRSR
jgi:hypothetical protein